MEKTTTIITPHHKLWSVDFREIWRYRDLIELFVKRNIVVQYKQTVLGPLWYIIQPIITVIMNMVVFGGIAKMSTDGVPQAIFYMAGNICWFYFADCLNQTSSRSWPMQACSARSTSTPSSSPSPPCSATCCASPFRFVSSSPSTSGSSSAELTSISG